MRILYILRNAEGGIRAHVETLMRGALAHGHDVLLLTDVPKADAAFKKTLETDAEFRKHVVSLPMRSAPGPWDLTALWLLTVGLRSARSPDGLPFDVVHGHGAKGGLFARLSRMLGILPRATRVIYTPHGGSLHAMHGRVMNRLYAWIERRLARFTDLVLLESRYTMNQFIERVGANRVPLKLNQNGIAPLAANLAPWPGGLGKSQSARIGAFGLLRSIKGFDVLIRALKITRDRGYDFQLDVWGEGQERETLKNLARELNLGDRVRIHHEISDAPSAMRECHIVAQPSEFESFGLVSLEAQALGCAVVASEVGGLVDVVQHQRTGLLVPPGDPAALAAALIWFIENPEETYVLRTRAAKRARDEFSAEKMVEGALAAYESTSGDHV